MQNYNELIGRVIKLCDDAANKELSTKLKRERIVITQSFLTKKVDKTILNIDLELETAEKKETAYLKIVIKETRTNKFNIDVAHHTLKGNAVREINGRTYWPNYVLDGTIEICEVEIKKYIREAAGLDIYPSD